MKKILQKRKGAQKALSVGRPAEAEGKGPEMNRSKSALKWLFSHFRALLLAAETIRVRCRDCHCRATRKTDIRFPGRS